MVLTSSCMSPQLRPWFSWAAHGQRIDLSRVEPRHTQHAEAKGDVVQEEESNHSLAKFFAIRRYRREAQKNADNQERDELTSSRQQHESSTAQSLDKRDGNEREYQICDRVDSDEQTRHFVRETDDFDENCGQILLSRKGLASSCKVLGANGWGQ